MKCLRHSQPYGLGRMIRFWIKYTDSEPEEQKRMLMDVEFWRLYQASFIGFQYTSILPLALKCFRFAIVYMG